MSIFDAYDQEFNSLCQEIAKNVSELKGTPTSDTEKSSGLIRQVEGLLNQAGDLIKQMEVEVRCQETSTRKVLLEKMASYKKSLSKTKEDFMSAKEKAQRSTLLGTKSIEQRERFVSINKSQMEQDQMINDSIRTIAETEEIGGVIMNELQRNSETIKSSHNKVREFSGITDTARRTLTSMARRDVKQKFILVFIAVILIIAIAVTVYYTTQKKKE